MTPPDSTPAPAGARLGVPENVTLESGMVRSSTKGRLNPLLVRDGPMFMRWAQLLSGAVASKGKRNWMHAHSDDDLERFLEAFGRHAEQWLDDVRARRAGRPTSGEDHAAALFFNVNGAEYVLDRLPEERAASALHDQPHQGAGEQGQQQHDDPPGGGMRARLLAQHGDQQ